MSVISLATRSDTVSPQELNLNAVLLTAQQTSNVFSIGGFNQLIIRVQLTRVAATAMTFFVETAHRPKTVLAPVAADTWDRVVSTVTGAGGTVTIDPLVATDGASVASTHNYVFPLSVSGWRARITFPIATGATTDTMICWAELSNV